MASYHFRTSDLRFRQSVLLAYGMGVLLHISASMVYANPVTGEAPTFFSQQYPAHVEPPAQGIEVLAPEDAEADPLAIGRPSIETELQEAEDHALGAQVRRSLLLSDSLSLSAKNVRIIVDHGTVILRGLIDSSGEASIVEQKASAIAGKSNVRSEISVASRIDLSATRDHS